MNTYTVVLLPAEAGSARVLESVELRTRAWDADEAEQLGEEAAKTLGARWGALYVDSVA